MARAHPAPSRRLLRLSLLGLLLVPVLVLAAANLPRPERATAAGQGGGHAQHTGHTQHDPVAAQGTEPGTHHIHTAPGTNAPITSLFLTWGASETHAGVPIDLAIQVMNPDGSPNPSRGGTASLLIDDTRARVTPAGGDQALDGSPVPTGQRVAVPLAGGKATVAISYANPGPHNVLAQLQDDLTIAGESGLVPVGDTFLVLQGPPTAVASSGRYTVVAQDAQGRALPGYAGTIVLATGDAGALIDQPAAGAAAPVQVTGGAGQGAAARKLDPADQGKAAFDVAFARGGTQTVDAYDADVPARRASVSVSVSGGSTTPAGPPATATGTPTPTATASSTPRGTNTATATATGTTSPRTAAATSADAAAPGFLLTSFQGSPSFSVALSPTSTNAGVPLSLTVTALTAGGQTDTAYRGQVKFTSTDAAFSPGTAYRYTFTAADNGVHVFSVTFNTAGAAQTITVTDTANAAMTGTSPSVAVAETLLSATFAAGTVQQGVSVNLTVQAKDSGGALVTGYRGKVQLSSTYNGVQWNNWGTGVDALSQYTFTATDAGSHTLTPKFSYAGDQTATITDVALGSRTVTTSVITVTNSPAGTYSDESAPTAVTLADGSILWAYVGVRGALYARRNVGTFEEPAYRDLVLVRDVNASQIGADTPAIALLGSTLALFHTYTDGTYFQIWMVTSTDNGATWSAPVKLTTEAGHVQRLQTVVSGGTLSLFWSRQDTNGKVFSQTTTDLTTWTAKTQLGQSIGVPVLSTTANFGITKLAAGSWLLGWIAPSAVGEPPFAPAGSLSYPVVKVATSSDLTSWSSATELTLAYSQRGDQSVSLAQDSSGTISAVFDQTSGGDVYIMRRTSTDAVSWTAQTTVGYDPSSAPTGSQGYVGRVPVVFPGIPGTTWVGAATQVTGSYGQWYGTTCWGFPSGSRGVGFVTVAALTGGTRPIPPSISWKDTYCAACAAAGRPVNAMTGHQWTSATDLAVAARGLPLVVGRTYNSYDGYDALDSPFGYGWSWGYGARALTHADGSVTIVDPNGKRLRFWKTGASWTAGPAVNATLAAAGGGYTLTRHDQTVWTFNAAGQLVSMADRSGNTQTLSYAGTNLASVSAPGGRTLTITTNAQGHITAISGPASLATSYTYDASGNLATATDAAGAVTTYTYDSRHQLLTVKDGNTHTVETNTYGTLGRVSQQVDAAGQTTTFKYLAEQGTTGSLGTNEVVDPRGSRRSTPTTGPGG